MYTLPPMPLFFHLPTYTYSLCCCTSCLKNHIPMFGRVLAWAHPGSHAGSLLVWYPVLGSHLGPFQALFWVRPFVTKKEGHNTFTL